MTRQTQFTCELRTDSGFELSAVRRRFAALAFDISGGTTWTAMSDLSAVFSGLDSCEMFVERMAPATNERRCGLRLNSFELPSTPFRWLSAIVAYFIPLQGNSHTHFLRDGTPA